MAKRKRTLFQSAENSDNNAKSVHGKIIDTDASGYLGSLLMLVMLFGSMLGFVTMSLLVFNPPVSDLNVAYMNPCEVREALGLDGSWSRIGIYGWNYSKSGCAEQKSELWESCIYLNDTITVCAVSHTTFMVRK